MAANERKRKDPDPIDLAYEMQQREKYGEYDDRYYRRIFDCRVSTVDIKQPLAGDVIVEITYGNETKKLLNGGKNEDCINGGVAGKCTSFTGNDDTAFSLPLQYGLNNRSTKPNIEKGKKAFDESKLKPLQERCANYDYSPDTLVIYVPTNKEKEEVIALHKALDKKATVIVVPNADRMRFRKIYTKQLRARLLIVEAHEYIYGLTFRRDWMYVFLNENSICQSYPDNDNTKCFGLDQVSDYEHQNSMYNIRLCFLYVETFANILLSHLSSATTRAAENVTSVGYAASRPCLFWLDVTQQKIAVFYPYFSSFLTRINTISFFLAICGQISSLGHLLYFIFHAQRCICILQLLWILSINF